MTDLKRLRNQRSVVRSTETVKRQTKFVEKFEPFPKRNLNLAVDKLNSIVKQL